jgi:hypothetical protein
MAAVFSKLDAARYWAGQKLLHSRFHPLYLKVTGKTPRPATYEEYLRSERRGPVVALDTARYRLVLEAGVRTSEDAAYWLMREAERTGVSRVYADEDVMDPARHSPVFRPGWSPELFAHCDYTGGCYLERLNSDAPTYARVPRVLFHRTASREYKFHPVARHASKALTSIIVCSRSPQLLDTCFQALQPVRQQVEILAVLHLGQGQDDALRSVAVRYQATPVEYDEAFHFGRMCNLAASRAHGELLLFLNDDVTPLEHVGSLWLDAMVAQAQRPEVGAVGALLYFPDGRIQHAGVLAGTPNGAGHPGRLSHGSPIWPWLTMTRDVSAVTGACLLMRTAVFRQLGGFDEVFPFNYNDVDLCLRAVEAGYRIIFESRARMEHAESTTRKTGIGYHERRRFLDRWARVLAAGDPHFSPNLTDDELLLPNAEGPLRTGEDGT